jgi:hypothetical protein
MNDASYLFPTGEHRRREVIIESTPLERRRHILLGLWRSHAEEVATRASWVSEDELRVALLVLSAVDAFTWRELYDLINAIEQNKPGKAAAKAAFSKRILERMFEAKREDPAGWLALDQLSAASEKDRWLKISKALLESIERGIDEPSGAPLKLTPELKQRQELVKRVVCSDKEFFIPREPGAGSHTIRVIRDEACEPSTGIDKDHRRSP